MSLRSTMLEQISNTITEWFHYEEYDGMTPCRTIQQLVDLFLKHCEKHQLELSCNNKQFRKYMCEALCVYKHAEMTDKRMIGPCSKQPKPSNWTDDAEATWNDYLHSQLFSSEFWEGVWHKLPVSIWEESVPDWRRTFQISMPDYVKRDISILSEAGLMFEDEDGEIIDAVEYDMLTEEHDERLY